MNADGRPWKPARHINVFLGTGNNLATWLVYENSVNRFIPVARRLAIGFAHCIEHRRHSARVRARVRVRGDAR